MQSLTNIERLQQAGLLRTPTKLSDEDQQKINENLTHGDINSLIDVARKLDLENVYILDHGVAASAF